MQGRDFTSDFLVSLVSSKAQLCILTAYDVPILSQEGGRSEPSLNEQKNILKKQKKKNKIARRTCQ